MKESHLTKPFDMEGTVISDAVNLASRVESLTKQYSASMLISDGTFHSLQHPEHFDLRVIDKVALKDKNHAATIWEVLNTDAPETRKLRLG